MKRVGWRGEGGRRKEVASSRGLRRSRTEGVRCVSFGNQKKGKMRRKEVLTSELQLDSEN